MTIRESFVGTDCRCRFYRDFFFNNFNRRSTIPASRRIICEINAFKVHLNLALSFLSLSRILQLIFSHGALVTRNKAFMISLFNLVKLLCILFLAWYAIFKNIINLIHHRLSASFVLEGRRSCSRVRGLWLASYIALRFFYCKIFINFFLIFSRVWSHLFNLNSFKLLKRCIEVWFNSLFSLFSQSVVLKDRFNLSGYFEADRSFFHVLGNVNKGFIMYMDNFLLRRIF